MFAPNADMMHVVNHCEGKPVADKRNVLQESARIARGEVTDLAKLDVANHDALIIPGQSLSLEMLYRKKIFFCRKFDTSLLFMLIRRFFFHKVVGVLLIKPN